MRRILLLGIALTLAACGSDHQPTGPSSITGSYSLATIDEHALPFNVVDLGAYQANLVSGTLTLNPDGTYALEYEIRIDDSGNIRTTLDTDAGLWNVVNDVITLTSTQRSFSQTGTVAGNALTLQSSIRSLVFRK